MFKSKIKYQILVVSLTLLIVIGNNLISFLPSHGRTLVGTEVSSAGRIETSNTNLISQQPISEQKYQSLLKDAQFLTAEGHQKLSIGDAETALQYWQQATRIYQQLDDKTGVVGSLINQSLSLQALGLSRRSCKVLVSAFKPDSQICEPSNQLDNKEHNLENKKLNSLIQAIQEQPDSSIRFLGFQTLGDILRVVGNLEESEKVLQNILNNETVYSNYEISAGLLSLANTQKALYDKEKDLSVRSGSPSDIKKSIEIAKLALIYYQQALDKTTNTTNKNFTTIYNKLTGVKIYAKINRLSLLLDLEKWKPQLEKENRDPGLIKEIQSELASSQIQIQSIIHDLQNKPLEFSKLTPIEEIYARLNFAKTLIQLKQLNIPEFAFQQNTSQTYSNKEKELTLLALNEANNAVLEAQSLKNHRLEAYSLGSLGYIYEQTKEWNSAKEFTKNALIIAEAITAPDIVYQLQWQLARIYKNINNIEKAKNAYDVAVITLDSVRRDLLVLNQNIEFSFSKDVQPVYEEYIDLLLTQVTLKNKFAKKNNRNQDNLDKNLKRITEVTSSLQLAKIENFLRCVFTNRVLFTNPKLIEQIKKVDKAPSAIIYPIFLKNRLEIIVITPQSEKLTHYHPEDFSSTEFITIVNELRSRLKDKKEDIEKRILPHAQKLYNWLIKPLEADLPKDGTLVFVLDSNLQNIPLAVLHDKKQYLIEKYSIAISPGSELLNSKSLSLRKWKALLAGVSQKAESFPPDLSILVNVEDELKEIKNKVPHHILLNKQFRSDVLKSQINLASFPVVHIATHGTFSSDSEKTKIYAWDNPINVNQLNKLLQTRVETSSEAIELLVLSACETAKGDKQAALGIAGVALKAEARSIIASLWQVNDGSTVEFMKQLYENLNKSSTTKAEALQQVQKDLLGKDDYKHPNNWAPFILVGNWL